MKKIMDYFKKDPEGDFENGTALNQANDKRNWMIFGVFTAFAGAIYFAGDYFMGTQKKTTVIEPAIDFGAVIDNDFTNKDNQSALTAQQVSLDKQQRTIDKLLKTIESIENRNQAASLNLRRNFDNLEQVVTDRKSVV